MKLTKCRPKKWLELMTGPTFYKLSWCTECGTVKKEWYTPLGKVYSTYYYTPSHRKIRKTDVKDKDKEEKGISRL